jgi:hypothetical protein
LQNRLTQTSQTGGQWYIDTSPFSIPWRNVYIYKEREREREKEGRGEREINREREREKEGWRERERVQNCYFNF